MHAGETLYCKPCYNKTQAWRKNYKTRLWQSLYKWLRILEKNEFLDYYVLSRKSLLEVWMIPGSRTDNMTSPNGNIFRFTGPLCEEFPSQSPVTRTFGIFFERFLNERLSIQSRHSWLETPLRPFWRHCNELNMQTNIMILHIYLDTQAHSRHSFHAV